MIPNKIIVTVVELLIRKIVERYDKGDGPSIKIIIASMLTTLGLILTYNYDKITESSRLVLVINSPAQTVSPSTNALEYEIKYYKEILNECLLDKMELESSMLTLKDPIDIPVVQESQ